MTPPPKADGVARWLTALFVACLLEDIGYRVGEAFLLMAIGPAFRRNGDAQRADLHRVSARGGPGNPG